MQRLKGKTAMVVGAGSIGPGWGNGKATAVTFAREGAQVFCVDRNGQAAQETVDIITGEGGTASPFTAAVSRAAGPYYDVLVNKYYVDELYDRRFVDVGKTFAGAAWAFDIHIIDGLVNRLGWSFRLAGGGLRRAQTGLIGNYALSMIAGLLVVLVVYAGYAAGILQ